MWPAAAVARNPSEPAGRRLLPFRLTVGECPDAPDEGR